MVCRGHVENGAVLLDETVAVPAGTTVTIEPLEPILVPSLAEQLGEVIGIVDDLPENMAGNHDHYIHGKPKE